MNQQLSLGDTDFAKLCSIIHKQTGITLGEDRRSMLLTRLRGRLREVGETDFPAYIARLSSDEGERQELTNRVTTNETYFYRTPRIWDYFTETVVPEFQARREGRAFRVWSAAASSGEEAHTMGVVLEEIRRATNKLDYQIVGTDISSRVIKTANNGVYVGRAVSRFKREQPEMFDRHMVGNDEDGFKVAPQIKARIKFVLHNLMKPLKNTAMFDAIFLRNVLIYFSNEDQEQILRHIRNVIRPDGVLIIGESETLKHLKTDFEQIEPIIYRVRKGR